MNWTLEVVQVPVSDVEKAKEFYATQVGFTADHDTTMNGTTRFVQLTPPGSGCSIVISSGMVSTVPGTVKGLQLVVNDVHAARAELVGRGVDVGPVEVFAPEGLRPVREDDDLNNVAFCHFSDPDGNGWSVQQITARP